jgi:hypothetical protein
VGPSSVRVASAALVLPPSLNSMVALWPVALWPPISVLTHRVCGVAVVQEFGMELQRKDALFDGIKQTQVLIGEELEKTKLQFVCIADGRAVWFKPYRFEPLNAPF